MIEGFKEKLKENGQSLKWFYDKAIKDKCGIGYSGLTAQLNGYAPISDEVKKEIKSYMGE